MFQGSSAESLIALPDPPSGLTRLAGGLVDRAGDATERLIQKAEAVMDSLFSSLTALAERLAPPSGNADSSVTYVQRQAGNPDETAIIIISIILGFVFLMTVLNYRRRMAEIRYKTVERLAQEGQLNERQLDEFLGSKSRKTAFFMVIGWLAMFVGIALCVVSQISRWDAELLYPGIILSVIGLGVISTPIMLREMKKQEIL